MNASEAVAKVLSRMRKGLYYPWGYGYNNLLTEEDMRAEEVRAMQVGSPATTELALWEPPY